MKKILIAFAVLPWALFSCSQNIVQSQVPSVVLNTFKQNFPDAMDVEWEKKWNMYEVEFEIGNADHEVWIDNSGKIIKHIQDYSFAALPQPVRDAITKDYSQYKLEDVDMIEADGKVTYEVEFESGKMELIVTFSPDGKVENSYQKFD